MSKEQALKQIEKTIQLVSSSNKECLEYLLSAYKILHEDIHGSQSERISFKEEVKKIKDKIENVEFNYGKVSCE